MNEYLLNKLEAEAGKDINDTKDHSIMDNENKTD